VRREKIETLFDLTSTHVRYRYVNERGARPALRRDAGRCNGDGDERETTSRGLSVDGNARSQTRPGTHCLRA